MNDTATLKDLKRGQRARVRALSSTGGIRRRLLDIGLIEGTEVECLGKSPAGDPTAYLIRGAVIALRSEDSGQIYICK
ncbi:MAG TPA: ferrous iron transport protein A [Clostridiales bacterium]|jgi:ferrous iron transport protein A|nr:ferrous iron transport protein A [Clostridiales bacterium]